MEYAFLQLGRDGKAQRSLGTAYCVASNPVGPLYRRPKTPIALTSQEVRAIYRSIRKDQLPPQALRERSESVCVATRVGQPPRGPQDPDP